MYALHDLLNRDGRVLNRHARKMYGFLPGLVTAVHDPKSKRHQKGYVKVCFPGLQDVDGPDAPILPWARMVVPNAGGMIESKKTETKTVRQPVWTRTPRQVPYEVEVEVEEPIFAEIEEETEEPAQPKKGQQFQCQINGHFKGDRPWQGEAYNETIWDKGSNGAAVKADAKKILAEIKKAGLGDIGRDGTELATEQAQVKSAFEKVADRIERHTKRFYLLSYCTPARKGTHTVRIVANSKDPKGSGDLEWDFNADGFGPPPECDPKTPPAFELKASATTPSGDADASGSAKASVTVKAGTK